MRVVLTFCIVAIFLCGCSASEDAKEDPSARYPSIATSLIPATSYRSAASSPTPSAKPADKLAFLTLISSDLRAMVVEGYPWEYESTRGLKFNYDDVGPYSIPLENNDKSPFSGADMVAGELWHNMPLGDAIAITGIPRAAYWHIEDATGETWLTLYYDDGDVLSFCDTDSHEADYRLATATIRSYLPGPRSLQVGDSMDAVLQSFKVTPPDLAEKGDIPGCMTLYAENIIFQDSPFEHLLLAPSGIIESSSYYRWEDSGDAKAYIRYAHPIYPYAINELEIPEREYPYLPMYRLSFTIQEGIVVEYRWSMGAEAA